jgi:hypothetical protein
MSFFAMENIHPLISTTTDAFSERVLELSIVD